MDIQVLSASQLALVIRLNVFMDNHQTQGITTSVSASSIKIGLFNETLRLSDENNNKVVGSAGGNEGSPRVSSRELGSISTAG